MKIRTPGKTFFRYLIAMCVVLALTALLLLPIYRLTLNAAYERSVTSIQANLDTAVSRFDGNMLSLLRLDGQLSDEAVYMVKTNGGDNSDGTLIYNLLRCRRLFENMTANIDPVCQFIWLFRNNPCVITAGEKSSTIYLSRDTCFDSFVRFEGLETEELCRRILGGKDNVSLLPRVAVTLNDLPLGECLTAVAHTRNSASVFCAVYRVADLEKLFSLDQIMPEAHVRFMDESGGVLFDTGAGALDETIVTKTSSVLSGSFQICMPQRFFSAQVAPVRRLLVIYLIVALSLGFLCAVAAALYSYRPLDRFLKLTVTSDDESPELLPAGSARSFRDEFAYLTELNTRAQNRKRELIEQITSMRQSIRSSHIERLLLGGVPLVNEQTVIERWLPELKEPCRLAIIDIGYDRSEGEAEDTIVTMLPVFEKYAMHMTYFGGGQIYTVFGDKDLFAFEQAFGEINDLLTRNAFTKACATVSNIFTGADGLKQAFQSVQIAAITSIHSLAYVQDTPQERAQPIMPDTETLLQYINDGDGGAAEHFVLNALNILLNSGGTYDDVVRLYEMLRSRLITLSAEAGGEDIAGFMGSIPILEQFTRLAESASALAKTRSADKEIPAYKNEIIRYIDANFTDSNIYAGSIAAEFNVSTKQVYKVVRDLTGDGYSDYIEKLRIRKAAALLDETDESVNDIAIKCGFNSVSTFYRSFRHIMDTPPTSYRARGRK